MGSQPMIGLGMGSGFRELLSEGSFVVPFWVSIL